MPVLTPSPGPRLILVLSLIWLISGACQSTVSGSATTSPVVLPYPESHVEFLFAPVKATAVITEEPAQPLRAWSIAPDGAVFVVDAATRLYQLDPTGLEPLAQSPPLFEAGETPIYLAADTGRLFAGSQAISQTLVLDRTDFSQVTRLNAAGPLAIDPGRQVIMTPQTIVPPLYSGWVWIYNSANLIQPGQVLTTTCISGPPAVDPANRYLAIRLRNCSSSPPHQRDTLAIYDLDTLAELGQTEDFGPGRLDRPAFISDRQRLLTVYHAANGMERPVSLDAQAQEIGGGEWVGSYGARPVTDAAGEWVYLLRERGLAVRQGSDLALQSLLPFTTTAPADVLLSQDESQLYLFGNGWLSALPTAELHQLGVVPVETIPEAWLEQASSDSETTQLAVYPSPHFARDGQALLLLANPFEIYRTTGGGRSWQLATGATEAFFPAPGGSYVAYSPDFSQDQTLVAPKMGLKSDDGGQTWYNGWQSRLAFTSDRDGNREIYTMPEYGGDPQRMTDSPAAEENPAWSPAQTRLAFQSNRAGNWDIFTIRAGCSPTSTNCDLRQLTDHPADDLLPAWSPDSRLIAFVSTRDGNPELYLMGSDGQNQRRLTFDRSGDWRPAWLPDSRRLVFTGGRSGNNDIYLLTLPDNFPIDAEPAITPLVAGPADDRDPAVGNDGRLYFISDRAGTARTYSLDLNHPQGEPEAYAEMIQAEAHPAPYGDSSLIVSLSQEGVTNLYRASRFTEPEPLTNLAGFNGQPAAGPVWWQPGSEASLAWLRARD